MERIYFFDGKKINRSTFHKNKKIFNIYDTDVTKILASEKSPLVKKAHLNPLLDIMMMISLDHYV